LGEIFGLAVDQVRWARVIRRLIRHGWARTQRACSWAGLGFRPFFRVCSRGGRARSTGFPLVGNSGACSDPVHTQLAVAPPATRPQVSWQGKEARPFCTRTAILYARRRSSADARLPAFDRFVVLVLACVVVLYRHTPMIIGPLTGNKKQVQLELGLSSGARGSGRETCICVLIPIEAHDTAQPPSSTGVEHASSEPQDPRLCACAAV
jgi:hypothetical protein